MLQAVRREGLRRQHEGRAAGEPLHNHLDPTRLNELDRRVLVEAFKQVRNLQSRLARDLGEGGAAVGA